jgi:hypothetical protein
MHQRLALFIVISIALVPGLAAAQDPTPSAPPIAAALAKLTFLPADDTPAQAQARTRAFEYSDAYRLRAKIHRYASFATLPLFGAEAVIGQKLYTNPTPGKKSAHLVIGMAMGGLFAVNTVTGVWNLIEARKDPKGHTLRTLHGVLMLAADAGFLATAASGPHSHRGVTTLSSGAAAHRTIAFTSIGVALAGYALMLFGK